MDNKSEGNNMWRGDENNPFAPVSREPSAQPQSPPPAQPAAQPTQPVQPIQSTQPTQTASQPLGSSEPPVPISNQPAAQPTVQAATTNQPQPEQPPETTQLTPDNSTQNETPSDTQSPEIPQESLLLAEPIRWTASETIDQKRGKSWYITAISVVFLIVAGLVALEIFHYINLITAITTGLLAVLILVSMFVTAKSPVREIEYILTDSGLTINGQLHTFSEYRAFGVRRFGAMWQLVLVPIKRFGMSATIFIHEDQGEQIVDALGAVLPMEDIKIDMVDRITNKLKI